MEKDNFPKPPLEGIAYGEIAYWFLVAGVMIAFIGLVVYLASPGYIDKPSLMNYLWQGCDCQTIWTQLSVTAHPLPWYSSLEILGKGDRLATVGIAITCFAAVFGMWGASFQIVRSKSKLYLVFALIIAMVLTLSALGLIKLG
jgi:hypothetical protein